MEWSKTHVFSTFHICLAAQAALYYHYGINKYPLDKNCSAYFRTGSIKTPSCSGALTIHSWRPLPPYPLSAGSMIEQVRQIKILASSGEQSASALMTERGQQVFITGHSEYDPDTLKTNICATKSRAAH